MKNSVQVTAIIAVTILLAAGIVSMTIQNIARPYANEETVNVQGIATVDVVPDIVAVYFTVQTNASTSTQAKDENAEIVDEVITQLVREGFERKDITTQNFNIYPQYEWTEEGRKDNGYQATHTLRVEMASEESDRIGEAIDAGVNAGAHISHLSFELSRELENTHKAQAMQYAAEDARIKAEAVADGFDKKVGKLVSTSVDNGWGYQPWMMYEATASSPMADAMMAKEATTEIQVGEREITASVSATFTLK